MRQNQEEEEFFRPEAVTHSTRVQTLLLLFPLSSRGASDFTCILRGGALLCIKMPKFASPGQQQRRLRLLSPTSLNSRRTQLRESLLHFQEERERGVNGERGRGDKSIHYTLNNNNMKFPPLLAQRQLATHCSLSSFVGSPLMA